MEQKSVRRSDDYEVITVLDDVSILEFLHVIPYNLHSALSEVVRVHELRVLFSQRYERSVVIAEIGVIPQVIQENLVIGL